MSFAKNMGRHTNKVAKSLSNKCSKKPLDSAKKFTTDTIKTASKRAIQNTAEATGNFNGNEIAEKITSVSKKSVKELHNKDETEGDVDIASPKKR